MASFAPAYQNESNDAWLNEIVRDIVGPDRSGHVACASYGRDWDDDLVDAPDDEAILRSKSRTSRSDSRHGAFSPFPRSRSRLSTRPKNESHSRRRAATPTPTIGEASRISTSSQVKTLQAFTDSQAEQLRAASPWPNSDTTRVDAQMGMRSLASPVSSVSRPDSALFSAVSRSSQIRKDKGRLIPKAPAASQHYSRYSPSPALERFKSQDSIESIFTGFPAHPGVRPLSLNERKILGDAAGPVDDDRHLYPGPLPLTLIIIGVCLSVFIISLDRNIITTVNLTHPAIATSVC